MGKVRCLGLGLRREVFRGQPLRLFFLLFLRLHFTRLPDYRSLAFAWYIALPTTLLSFVSKFVSYCVLSYFNCLGLIRPMYFFLGYRFVIGFSFLGSDSVLRRPTCCYSTMICFSFHKSNATVCSFRTLVFISSPLLCFD